MKKTLFILYIVFANAAFANNCPIVSDELDKIIKSHAQEIVGEEYCRFRRAKSFNGTEIAVHAVEGPCFDKKEARGSCGNRVIQYLSGISNGKIIPTIEVERGISVEDIEISGNTIVLKGLAWGEGDASCCPSIKAQKSLKIVNSEFTFSKPTPRNKNSDSAEKIIGAFGKELGAKFEPSSAIGSGELTDGTPMFQFSPTNRFRSFSKYYVMISPKSHIIYSIWGIGSIENDPTCKKEQQVILAILKDKYGQPLKKDLSMTLFDTEMIDRGGRDIVLKCHGFMDATIEIRYTDRLLKEQANNERIEIEGKKLDSSGL